MQSFTVNPPNRYRVVVAGGVVAAADALDKYVDDHRPMADAAVNGYGAVHATVWAFQDEMSAWWEASHERGPGALLFYMGGAQ